MKSYLEWLRAMAGLETVAARISARTPAELLPLPELDEDAPVAVICSPHPDDEAIIGALPLRLRREGWRVVNLAITLGSLPLRRRERSEELAACCSVLGFDLEIAEGSGWEKVQASTRRAEPERWKQQVSVVAATLERWQAKVVFYPHAEDHHATHIGTSLLVADALEGLPAERPLWRVETEFWRPMGNPNLLVGVSPEQLAHQMHALCQHVGEVSRNPYHLRLPAWMADNVRRGSEVVAGAGAKAQRFHFGTLYRLFRVEGTPEPRVLSPVESASGMF